MAKFELEEVEEAFRLYWQTGMIREDWDAWCDLFVEDVEYIEHVLGPMRGRDAVRAWIIPLMEQYREIYGVYEWHMANADGRVVFSMQNRRDHPSGEGYLDFPGLTVLTYAGNMKWAVEEDYWDEKLGIAQFKAYGKALKEHPGHREAATRLHWGDGPEWTKGPASYWHGRR